MKRFLALLAAASLLLAACSENKAVDGPDPAEDPAAALNAALTNLGEGANSLTLSIASTPESLAALSADDGGEPISAEDAQMILDSSVTVSANGGDDPAAVEMSADVAGIEDAVEIRFVDDTLYARADVRGLAETFGSDISKLEQEAAQPRPGFEFLPHALEGGWLSVAGLRDLIGQFVPQAPSPEPSGSGNEKIKDALVKAVGESSEVTSEGSDDIGDHLLASVDIQTFYSNIGPILSDIAGPTAGAALPPASEVPAGEVKVDVWVSDDQVRQIEIDFLQFAALAGEEVPEGAEEAALRLVVEEFEGVVEAPEDAVPFDPRAFLLQGAGGGGSTARGGAPPTPGD